VDLGAFNEDTLDNEGMISWSINRYQGKRTGTGAGVRIAAIVAAEPFVHTKTEIAKMCSGKVEDIYKVFESMVQKGEVISQKGPHVEKTRTVNRDLWGPGPGAGKA
jgi:hypothetical protein